MKMLFVNIHEWFQKHQDEILGSIGAGAAISFPMMDFLTHVFQCVGAIGGLLLLYFSIKHKMLEIKIKKQEYDKSNNIQQK